MAEAMVEQAHSGKSGLVVRVVKVAGAGGVAAAGVSFALSSRRRREEEQRREAQRCARDGMRFPPLRACASRSPF